MESGIRLRDGKPPRAKASAGGNPRGVSSFHALAATFFSGTAFPAAMARDDSGNAPFYIAVGALAAVGVGYLMWRYGLSDETKEKVRLAAQEGVQKARVVLKDNLERALDAQQTGRLTR
jgi:hypothetical protein